MAEPKPRAETIKQPMTLMRSLLGARTVRAVGPG
jgi:hypothetical protein